MQTCKLRLVAAALFVFNKRINFAVTKIPEIELVCLEISQLELQICDFYARKKHKNI